MTRPATATTETRKAEVYGEEGRAKGMMKTK